MSNVNEALMIARKEVINITKCDNAQKFMNKCLGTEFINCAESLRWYKHHDRISNVPKSGDQIFINNSTGIVELVSGSVVYTIELDTDVNSMFFGFICRKKRDINVGIYGRPIYDSVEFITGPKNVDEIKQWLLNFNIRDDIQYGLIKAAKISVGNLPDDDFGDIINTWKSIKRGHIGMQAQVVQAALICAGYSCGKYGANGYFGEDSVDAVKKFQKNNKMIRDGVVSKAVAMKLFKEVAL